jgi:hypothetical protein
MMNSTARPIIPYLFRNSINSSTNLYGGVGGGAGFGSKAARIFYNSATIFVSKSLVDKLFHHNIFPYMKTDS